MPELTPEQLEDLKSRDARLRAVDLGLMVSHASQAGECLGHILAFLEADQAAAMRQFVNVSPTDAASIAMIQVRVLAFHRLRDLLNGILTAAGAAEQSLRDNDMVSEDERNEY